MRLLKRVVFLLIATLAKVQGAALIPEFFRAVPQWEANHRAVVAGYSDDELVGHFMNLRMPGTAVPQHIEDALRIMVGYNTGKAVLSDIVARLEPMIAYAESLRAFVTQMDAEINAGQHEQAVRIALGLIQAIEPNALADDVAFYAYLPAIEGEWLGKLDNNPEVIALVAYQGGLSGLNFVGLSDFFRNGLNDAIQKIEGAIGQYRFQFGDANDSYDHGTRMISVTDATTVASVIYGPKLIAIGGTICGVRMEDGNFTVDERLLHEIIHYVHITLRKAEPQHYYFTPIDERVIARAFCDKYAERLRGLWSNYEEFWDISGLFIDQTTGNLMFTQQSESRYLFEKGKGFRCSHYTGCITKIPWYFIQALLSTGIDIATLLVRTQDREYSDINDFVY